VRAPSAFEVANWRQTDSCRATGVYYTETDASISTLALVEAIF